LLVLAALAVVAGCEPATRSAAGPAADSYFPLVPGATWVYSLRSSLIALEVEVEAVGEMPLPGGRGAVFVMEERNRGPSFGFAEVAPVGYLVRGAYFARLAGIDYGDSGTLRLLGQDEPTWMLPLDPKPGQTWSQQTRMFRTPEGGGGQMGWTGEVKPLTTLTVPAGRFEDVVEIEMTYRDISEGMAPQILYRDFYARGVGLLKSIVQDPSGEPSNRIEQVLLEFQIPK
jgi:hypothetical protein